MNKNRFELGRIQSNRKETWGAIHNEILSVFLFLIREQWIILLFLLLSYTFFPLSLFLCLCSFILFWCSSFFKSFFNLLQSCLFFFFFLMCWFFFLAARHLWSNLHDQGLSLHPLHCMAVFTRGLLGKSHDQVVLMSCIDYNFIP